MMALVSAKTQDYNVPWLYDQLISNEYNTSILLSEIAFDIYRIIYWLHTNVE